MKRYNSAVAMGVRLSLAALAASPLGIVRAGAAETPAYTEDVTVTANKRAEDILRVPVAVSVFTNDALEKTGALQLRNIASLSPALGSNNSISNSYGQFISVRGITASAADTGLESAIGINLDGVPLARSTIAVGDLMGVERIELLRGPQGTLFGKSATSGVINIVTAKPTADTWFETAVRAGNRNQWRVEATANGELASALAGRIDVSHYRSLRYLSDAVTNAHYNTRESTQMRGQLLWAPTDDFSLRLIADYFHNDGTPNGPVYRVVGIAGPVIAALGGHPLIPFPGQPDSITQVDADSPRLDTGDNAGLSAEADWQSALGQVIAIAGYRDTSFDRSYDVDGSPADLVREPYDGEHYRMATGELRLQGEAARWHYLVGIFASDERIRSKDSYRFGADFDLYANALASGMLTTITSLPLGSNFPAGDGISDVYRTKSQSIALFTHDSYALTDRLTLTAGLRYTYEAKDLDTDFSSVNPGCSAALTKFGRPLTGVPAALQGVVCIPNVDPRYDGRYAASLDESDWSGVAAADYALIDGVNLYLSYARGYKPSGFQMDRSGMNPLAPSASQLEFGNESADSYEGGLKSEFWGGKARASLMAFHTSFNDYQYEYFTGLNRITTNVPKLTTKGVELETSFTPRDDLRLTFGAIFQDARFGSGDFPASLMQLQGTEFPFAPHWVTTGSLLYHRAIPGTALEGFIYTDARWQSAANVGASATVSPAFRQDSYATVNGRIGFGPADDGWKLELWARNLFDRHAWSVLNNTVLQPGSISGYVIDPLSWGITASARW